MSALNQNISKIKLRSGWDMCD